MNNYKKSLVSALSKISALVVIVSILLPVPVVNVVYAQVAEAIAVADEVSAPALTAEVTPTDVSTKTDVVVGGAATNGAGNLGGGPTVCERVDANHDGVLNNADFVTFTTLYTAHDPAGDFNQDGAYNVLDFQAFLDAFPTCSGTGSISLCTRADMNDDGVLTPADFTAFETAFYNQTARADFDMNGFYNTNDFQAFTNAYAGCTHPVLPTPACVLVDINNDGVLNAADFAAFETAFNNNEMRTDFDHNGLLNANDFQAYMNAFAECGGNGATTLCVRADMNDDGVLTPADFTAFETAYNNHDNRADFDLNGSLNANDFQSFLNAYASCAHGTTTPPNGNITVSTTSGTTSEDGSTVAISVALGSTPTSPVTINLSSNDTTEGTPSTGTLTFDASHMTQSFVVTGVDDSSIDGNQNYSIVFAPTISSDSNYNGLHVNDISLVNTDNDVETTGGGGGGTGGSGGGGGSSGGSGGRRIGGGFGDGMGGGGEVLGASTVNGICNFLGSYLKKGENNDMVEVMKLQSFLKTNQGFSDLEVNGIFDDATFAAVSAFQKKFASEILLPWGYSADHSTGYVYILTKNEINKIFCGQEIALTPAQKDEIDSFKASKSSLAMADEASKKKLGAN